MCTQGCNGGGGTSGKGRTAYTPKKNTASLSRPNKSSSGGGSTRDGRASQYGKPTVKASFGRKK